MPVLKNERHERFCQLKVEESVKSNPRSDAELYVQVGFAENGAAANARRLIRTDKRISARIKELGGLIGEAVTARVRPVIGQQVTSREGRVLMLADHLTDLYAIRDDRKSEQYKERYDQVPGAASGFMTVRAAVVGGRPVKESSFDRALALEIRATLQQIAMELGQWGREVPCRSHRRAASDREGGTRSSCVRLLRSCVRSGRVCCLVDRSLRR